MPTADCAPTAALLLAAGLSSRMGQPKPLLPWGPTPLVVWQVEQLQQAGVDCVVVVTGHAGEAVAAALAGSGAIIAHNADYAAGRAGSVRVGAAALPDDLAVVALLNVDQPRPAAVTRALLAAHHQGAALITTPLHAGRHGHPVLFAGALLPELRAVTEAGEGVRMVLRVHRAETIETPIADPRVLLDLNTPDAYQAALPLFGLSTPAG